MDPKHKLSACERSDVLVGEEEEVRFLPENEQHWKSNLDSSNLSSGYSGQTGVSSFPPDGSELSSDKNTKKPMGGKSSGKNYLSPSSANKKKCHQRKSEKHNSEPEYHVKSSSDATVVTAMTANGEDNCQAREPIETKAETIRQHQHIKEEEIIVIDDEIQSDLN